MLSAAHCAVVGVAKFVVVLGDRDTRDSGEQGEQALLDTAPVIHSITFKHLFFWMRKQPNISHLCMSVSFISLCILCVNAK